MDIGVIYCAIILHVVVAFFGFKILTSWKNSREENDSVSRGRGIHSGNERYKLVKGGIITA